MSNVLNGNVADTGLIKGTVSGTGELRGSVGALLARDGVPATHSWNGTILTVTSASGTSSADLKGEKGDKGDAGAAGAQGAKGDKGEQGIQGVQGERGEKGDTGSPGKDGYTPKKGVDYFDGAKGDKGDKGDTGERGEQGVSGVYVGTGSMPAGYNVQINPSGNADAFVDYVVEEVVSRISKGSDARIAEVVLLANAWVGTKTPYAQVVSIPTVTENTQVDLTPSVEQLSVFYEKDLTFVTENEDGVVTVYAIGQKPTSDYTIQATLKEINV